MAMTLEQFYAFASQLPEGTDTRRVARSLGLTLPAEPIAPLVDQLAQATVVRHTAKVSKTNPTPQEKVYVDVPSLKLSENDGTRGFWVRGTVARQIAQTILRVCDQNNL